MTHVILVHGAFANELSWFDVPAALKSAGHTVDAIRLPGHEQGFEQVPKLLTDSSVTLDDYVVAVEKALPASPEKCCLIGHSMGGMVISQAAAKIHGRVERLIYVAAMLPKDGETAQQIIDRSKTGVEDILTEFRKHDDPRVLLALSRQPPKPLEAAFIKTAGFAALARHYIRCADDGILPASLQDQMIDVGKPIEVIKLDSDHLPQLSVPDKLNKALTGILA